MTSALRVIRFGLAPLTAAAVVMAAAALPAVPRAVDRVRTVRAGTLRLDSSDAADVAHGAADDHPATVTATASGVEGSTSGPSDCGGRPVALPPRLYALAGPRSVTRCLPQSLAAPSWRLVLPSVGRAPPA